MPGATTVPADECRDQLALQWRPRAVFPSSVTRLLSPLAFRHAAIVSPRARAGAQVVGGSRHGAAQALGPTQSVTHVNRLNVRDC